MSGDRIEFWLIAIFNVAIPISVILLAWLVGSLIERRHYRSIIAREQALGDFTTTTFEKLPQRWRASEPMLVTGSVVVSIDYFKRLRAGVRAIFGGRIKHYEPLLDRARREACLRMIDSARVAGYNAVINTRIETAKLASTGRRGDGTAGVEILAFGTAVHLTR
ncbi:MAG: heavy metal-binding domain-containing protein [Gammaproteobacteria bacterium]|nr:heavy metal-binding domain-containing protein [Gammaproteobacteria bacterium]